MSALKLVQRTELDRHSKPPHYGEYDFDPLLEGVSRLVTVRDYGSGCVEVGLSSVRSPSSERETPESDDRSRKSAKNDKTRQANFVRSMRRSRAQVRRKCMAGGLDHLLTLTYRANVGDALICYQDWSRFVRLVRKRYPDWAYVCVHEFQKRGAVHFHVAVRGFQDVRHLRNCWRQVVGDGNIHVQGPRTRGSAVWRLAHLAGYLSKYIMKNATFSNGRQRYRVSEGIEIPKDTFLMTVRKGRSIVREVFDSLGVTLGHQWESPDGFSSWACSWEY